MIGYVELEKAYEFLEKRYEFTISPDEFEKLLYRSLDKIEALDIRNSGIVNKFPRTNESEVPENIKIAQILEAYAIYLTNDTGNVNNVISRSTGSMSVMYKDNKLCGVEFKSAVAYETMRKYIRKGFTWA